MNSIHIGRLIDYERKKKKISLEKLSAGILTHTGLKRLEDGERIPSFFILERIMERLGKSVNKLEFLLHEKDYEIYYLRGKIEKEIDKEQLEEAGRSISYYEALPIAKEPLHRQYLCKMKSVISIREGETRRALMLLDEALGLSLWWWNNLCIEEREIFPDNIFEENPIGKEEINLILLWLSQMWEQGKEIKIDGKRLLSVFSRYYEDAEERADLFCKVCWVLGTHYMQKGEIGAAYFFTKEGEKALVEIRTLLYLPQYLERLVKLSEELEILEAKEWREQKDALKKLLLSYGKSWETREIPLWKNYKMQEVYLISEVVEQERKVRNKSQQEIAFELQMDPKTISRLEGGTYKPKKETLSKVRNYFEICRDVCNTRIITEDFSLLELERKISILEHLNREKEAEKLYLELKEKLDTKWKENRQYILYQEMLFDHQFQRISHEEALRRCRKAFHVTRPDVDPEKVDQLILGRRECQIINYMGICYRKMGQREKTISLLEKAMMGYKNSKVDKRYYFIPLGLIYLNLIDNYEESDRFEEALLLCNEAIHYEIDCGKCSNLGYLISEKQYTIDRMKGRVDEEGKKYYQQAFQLLRLMKREVAMSGLCNVYKKWYGEELT